MEDDFVLTRFAWRFAKGLQTRAVGRSHLARDWRHDSPPEPPKRYTLDDQGIPETDYVSRVLKDLGSV